MYLLNNILIDITRIREYEKKVIARTRFYEVDRFSILLNANNREHFTGKNTLLLLQSTFHSILIYINQYYTAFITCTHHSFFRLQVSCSTWTQNCSTPFTYPIILFSYKTSKLSLEFFTNFPPYFSSTFLFLVRPTQLGSCFALFHF